MKAKYNGDTPALLSELAQASAKNARGLKHYFIDPPLTLVEMGHEFKAYGVNIGTLELSFECDKGYVSYAVDTYGDRCYVSLWDYELSDD